MPLHLRKMSAKTSKSDILDRNGLIISPPLLKMWSIGELDAGALRARKAEQYSLSSCCWCSHQNEKQSNDGSYGQSIDTYFVSYDVTMDCSFAFDCAAKSSCWNKYKYEYPAYEYEYCKTVLEYNSSTNTSTEYYISVVQPSYRSTCFSRHPHLRLN